MDVALGACAQAGQRGLPTALSFLREDVVETRRRLEESSTACDVERQSIEAWLQENPDEGAVSGTSEAATAPALAGSGVAPSPVQPTAPPATPARADSPSDGSLEARDIFDQLLDPRGSTLLPREVESDGPRLRSRGERDFRRADDTDAAPGDGLTRRTRRALAWTAAGTFIGQATIGAALEMGSYGTPSRTAPTVLETVRRALA